MEFADHKEYFPGDDFRSIDWNVYARLEELVVKNFETQENLRPYVLLDCSASMASGNPHKGAWAKRLAAALRLHALTFSFLLFPSSFPSAALRLCVSYSAVAVSVTNIVFPTPVSRVMSVGVITVRTNAWSAPLASLIVSVSS